MSTGDPVTTTRFRRTAGTVLDALLEARPSWATGLGDHRFDDRLEDWSPGTVETHARLLADALGALDDLDDTVLEVGDRVDLEVLRTRVAGDLWASTELREHTWNPLVHLPGDALYGLLARETGPAGDRLRALAARLAAVPEALATARGVLRTMPRVHVQTALARLPGIVGMLGADVDALLERAPGLRRRVDPAREAARAALEEHGAWLAERLPEADRDPRRGARDYAAELWYSLDTETDPDALLVRAESDLMAVEESIARVASSVAGEPVREGLVREVLDSLADEAPVDDASILARCREALEQVSEAIRSSGWVTVHDDPVEVIEMPESRRGVAVAYCDPPGPLEADGLPTYFAVSPTPADWPAARVRSFYREYNRHMLVNLAAHEAVPGHVLQLSHSRRHRGSTLVRRALWSGTFVEGWAVYAEELMADCGLGDDPRADAALRLQQLKMQLRTTINTILDVRVHAHGMTEAEAMHLMTVRGHQEEGEAAGKWRRALLTSAQLPTYYVGYREVSDLLTDLHLAEQHYTPRDAHDAVLGHGSPPPRHLRTLLGLPPASGATG